MFVGPAEPYRQVLCDGERVRKMIDRLVVGRSSERSFTCLIQLGNASSVTLRLA